MRFNTTNLGLREIISHGESQTVEFKESSLPQEDVAKLLTAFANSGGGILIIGVAKGGQIIGLTEEESKVAVDDLESISASFGEDIIHAGRARLEGCWVVYVEAKPVPLHRAPLTTSRGEVYKRTASKVTKLPQREAWSLMNKSGLSTEIVDKSKSVHVFVAMSFREEEEPELVDYFSAMKRAVTRTELPMELCRIDLTDGDYEISQRILDEISRCDIILADFTLCPRNVYFELGYSRGVGKRVIQMARKGVHLEFDIRNWRTLFYRNATELEERLVPELIAAFQDVTNTTN